MNLQDVVRVSKRVFVDVANTEFYIKTTKQEVKQLVQHLGGWEKLNFDRDGMDVYLWVEPDER